MLGLPMLKTGKSEKERERERERADKRLVIRPKAVYRAERNGELVNVMDSWIMKPSEHVFSASPCSFPSHPPPPPLTFEGSSPGSPATSIRRMVRCKVFASIAARAASPWTTDARREETAAKCPPRLLHGTQTPPTGVIDHLGWLHTVSWRSSLVSLSPWSVWVLVCVSVFGCLGECRQCRPDPDSRHTTTPR